MQLARLIVCAPNQSLKITPKYTALLGRQEAYYFDVRKATKNLERHTHRTRFHNSQILFDIILDSSGAILMHS